MPRRPSDRVPTASTAAPTLTTAGTLDVKMPGTGVSISLLSVEEVKLWNSTVERYSNDYRLTRTNDLILLGGLVSQVLLMYRAQRQLGDPEEALLAQATITKASEEIRKAEAALGLDKKTRDKGGVHDVGEYVKLLKRAAYEKGVHITDRVKRYEEVCMEARWRIRVLRNADDEDRRYHKVENAEAIVKWLESELAKLEEADKRWAKEKGSLYVGKL